MISYLFCWYVLTYFLFKNIELLRNQFLGLFFRFHYFFFLIPNFLFFCYFLYFHYSLIFWSFSFLLFFLYLFFPSFYFCYSGFLCFSLYYFPHFFRHSFILLFLFSSQSQDYSKLTMIFPKLYSNFTL